MIAQTVIVRRLGQVPYVESFEAMRAFTRTRTASTPDEVWLLEHPPVYTFGLRTREEHAALSGVACVRTDRGGDATYHGPGQAVAYTLIDLTRRALGVSRLVTILEQAVLDVLAHHDIAGQRRPGAPGVYVQERKIASLGLRVKNGRVYHGVAFNVNMDLAPFGAIDPCGYPGLAVTHLADFVPQANVAATGTLLAEHLLVHLGYTSGRADTPVFDAAHG